MAPSISHFVTETDGQFKKGTVTRTISIIALIAIMGCKTLSQGYA
jgi:hypothetical protein